MISSMNAHIPKFDQILRSNSYAVVQYSPNYTLTDVRIENRGVKKFRKLTPMTPPYTMYVGPFSALFVADFGEVLYVDHGRSTRRGYMGKLMNSFVKLATKPVVAVVMKDNKFLSKAMQTYGNFEILKPENYNER